MTLAPVLRQGGPCYAKRATEGEADLPIKGRLDRRGLLALLIGAAASPLAGVRAGAAGLACPTGKVEVIAHRGFAQMAPENTLAAFTQALDLGYHALEFDLRLTKDGVPVVLHDATLDRTTDGTGAVADLVLADITGLNAAARQPNWPPQRIPLFEQVVALAKPGHARLYAEIKQPANAAGIAEMVRVVREAGLEGQTCFCSFQLDYLRKVRAESANVALALIASDIGQLSAFAELSGDRTLMLRRRPLLENEGWVAACRATGTDVSAWPVSSQAQVRELARADVYRITCDRPLVAPDRAC